MRIVTWTTSVCALAMLAISQPAWAASPSTKPAAKVPAEVVELFAGMESGEIEVKVFPKDATGGTLTIKNNTGKPLTIKVPEVFAGVPVLAQGFGGGGMGGMGGMGGGGMGGGGNQGFGGGMGGGMGGMGGGGMMGGMGGGMFNVPAEKVTKLKFAAVCLDHGKDDPNSRIPYKLVPIESYAKDAAVTEVIKLMLQKKVDQHSAQAAVWNLQNGLSWQDLATKVGAKHLNGTIEPYFTPLHLQRALAAAKQAQRQTEESGVSSQVSTDSNSEGN